jgi:hypothetical protein
MSARHGKRRCRRPIGLACATIGLLSVPLLVGGCGGSTSSGVAHLPTRQGPASASATAGAAAPEGESAAQRAVAYAHCMRTHGISDFPDPDSQGELTTEAVKAAGVDVHAPDVQAAAQTCLPAARCVLTEADIKRAERKAP